MQNCNEVCPFQKGGECDINGKPILNVSIGFSEAGNTCKNKHLRTTVMGACNNALFSALGERTAEIELLENEVDVGLIPVFVEADKFIKRPLDKEIDLKTMLTLRGMLLGLIPSFVSLDRLKQAEITKPISQIKALIQEEYKAEKDKKPEYEEIKSKRIALQSKYRERAQNTLVQTTI